MRDAPFAGALLLGMALSGLTRWALWVEYISLDGQHQIDELTAYLSGATDWTPLEHDKLAVALNEACSDLGLGTPVDYRTPTAHSRENPSHTDLPSAMDRPEDTSA